MEGHESRRTDAGFTMVVTMASLVIAAALVALVLSATLSSHGTSQPGIANAPGVSLADNLQAQQTLATSLTAAATAGGAGDFSAVTADMVSAANPSIRYVEGPSSSSSVVSVATSATGGSLTLVARAAGGTCWVVWAGSGGTWYGAQTNQTSCTAPSLDVAPMASPVSATAIGWQRSGFPAA
ncbi:MAG TPA: hypothetical protein VGG43_15000 [Acidimicrobiales bacterium]